MDCFPAVPPFEMKKVFPTRLKMSLHQLPCYGVFDPHSVEKHSGESGMRVRLQNGGGSTFLPREAAPSTLRLFLRPSRTLPPATAATATLTTLLLLLLKLNPRFKAETADCLFFRPARTQSTKSQELCPLSISTVCNLSWLAVTGAKMVTAKCGSCKCQFSSLLLLLLFLLQLLLLVRRLTSTTTTRS